MGLMKFKMYGRNGVVDWNLIQAANLSLQTCSKDFDAKIFWNADKCGLFYKLAPTSAVAIHRLSGQKKKKQKDRITVFVAASMGGVEKFPLFFICSS